jgi:hypothetical protein
MSDVEIQDFDMEAASASIGEALGGSAEESIDLETSPQVSSAPSSSEPPPAAPAPVQNAWDTPPKSWKGEMHPHYSKVDPQVRQYIHEREKQALDGLMQYKTQWDPYSKINEQFKPWFEHYGKQGVTPDQVYQRMIQSHIALSSPGMPQEQKLEYLKALVKDYGLETTLRSMFGQSAPPASPEAGMQPQPNMDLSPILNPLQERLGRMEQTFQTIQQREEEEKVKKVNEQVSNFLNDPKNEFAKELVPDMERLIKTNYAETLEQAYEAACQLNPGVRAKILNREIEKATQPRKPGPPNVRSGKSTPTPTTSESSGDMGEDMARLHQKILSR